MPRTPVAFVCTALLLACCNPEAKPDSTVASPSAKDAVPDAQPPATAIVYSTDSLQKLAFDKTELIAYNVGNDTLEVVSTSDFLFHPFGKYSSINAFSNAHSGWRFQQKNDPEEPSAQLYRSKDEENVLNLFLDTENNTLEIVSGSFVTKIPKFSNGIRLHMKKPDFFSLFLKKHSEIENKANVVVLVSALNGIKQYYNFENNILNKIEFVTNYQLDKN